jgi:hypothetical protein
VYGTIPGQFPNDSFQATNYWVDPIFDTQPPPNVVPVLTNPGQQNGAVASPVNLQWADQRDADNGRQWGGDGIRERRPGRDRQ